MEPTWLINETPLSDASATIGGLVEALAKAQAEFPTIEKTKEAVVTSEREGRKTSYQYKYADLADILAKSRPVLGKHGIAVVQRLSTLGDLLKVETIMMRGEEWIRSSITAQYNARSFNVPQVIAGLSTYLKRYAYCAMVGLQAEEDTDNNSTAEEPAPRRVEASPAEVEGRITAAQQKKLREGLALTGLSLNKLVDAVVDDGEERPRLLKDIPADRMARAEAAIERALRASEGDE